MIENVEKFFALYNSDPALQQRVQDAEDMYPGSLELRVPLVENVLLPIAEDLGLPFTVRELRIYETRLKQSRSKDAAMTQEELDNDEEYSYWLIDRGWQGSEAKLCDGCGGDEPSEE